MKLENGRLVIDEKERALTYFKQAADWIERHKDCTTCDKREWQGMAKTLSKMIMVYLDETHHRP